MPWFEYNLHMTKFSFQNVRDAILDFIGPFIMKIENNFRIGII